MNRIGVITGVLILVGGILWRFPLFHVRSLDIPSTRQQAAVFNAREFAADYWRMRLTQHLANAHDAAAVLAAIETDPPQARTEFGRTVGLGRSCYFFLRGEGTIVSVEKNSVGVTLSDDAGDPDLLVVTGPVFGNAVRDAPGLLTAGDFPRSQHFNELAVELNSLVENRIGQPLSKQARIGGKVHFVGCVELLGDKAARPFKLIPLEASVE